MVDECKGRSVYPTVQNECAIAVQMDGRFIARPSVGLESKSYPGKSLRVEADTAQVLLKCLIKRGFSPPNILAKQKPAEPEQPIVQSLSTK